MRSIIDAGSISLRYCCKPTTLRLCDKSCRDENEQHQNTHDKYERIAGMHSSELISRNTH
jgi:hypothetical protein